MRVYVGSKMSMVVRPFKGTSVSTKDYGPGTSSSRIYRKPT